MSSLCFVLVSNNIYLFFSLNLWVLFWKPHVREKVSSIKIIIIIIIIIIVIIIIIIIIIIIDRYVPSFRPYAEQFSPFHIAEGQLS